jgi:FkbM family methyltransferase
MRSRARGVPSIGLSHEKDGLTTSTRMNGLFAYIKHQNVFRTRAFRVAPVLTLWRLAMWLAFHVLPKRPAVIKVKVGDTSFRLRLPPILRHHGSTGIYVQRSNYEPLLEYCNRLVTKGAVVIDCGANQGIYACAFGALVGPRGRVYAFEPQAYAVEALCRNIELNGFAHVSVEQVAISNGNGTAMLDLSSGPVSASILRNMGGGRMISVPTLSLTSFAERVDLRRLDLIKMDIEGAEYDALVGAIPIIARFKPTIVLEATPRDILVPVEKRWNAIVELLTSYGYAMHRFNESGRLKKTDQLADFDPDVVFLPN